MTPFAAELVGTMFVFVLGGGVVAGTILSKTKASGSGWIVITLGWGFAVAFPVYAVGSISGAHLNPAVTLALAVAGDFAWEQVPAYVAAQLLGAFLGATFVWVYYLPHWKETLDAGTKLAVFATGPAVRKTWSNLVSEMLGTAVLLFGLQVLGANRFGEGLNPLIVGFLIVSIGLSLGATTGYAINPARDLGPRLAHAVLPIVGKGPSDWPYAWIPVVGPCLGGVLGALGYKALFTGRVNPLLWVFAALALGVILVAVFTENRSRPEGPGQPEKN
jgi:glycerol uptake facilitator protein